MKTVLVMLTMASLLSGQKVWAAEHTVTYTITYSGQAYDPTLIFTPDNGGFGGDASPVSRYLGTNFSNATNFSAQLHDGISVAVNLRNYPSSNRMYVQSIGVALNGNANFQIYCSEYYITHIKLANSNNQALYGRVQHPFESIEITEFDLDVDTDYSSDAPDMVRGFNAQTTSTFCSIAYITVTLSDKPRQYTIEYVDVGSSANANPKSYNVTTPDFQILAERISRPGFSLDGLFYDSNHTQPVNLPVSIPRGSAATLKNITYYALWTDIWPGGGDGTENNPYMITSPTHLAELANRVCRNESFEGVYFRLGCDIDMDGIPFNGIGYGDRSFRGTFDGDGYTIWNINIGNEPDCFSRGLFGNLKSATVKNIILDGATIDAGDNSSVGGIAGGADQYTTISYCVLRNCTISAGDWVGGVVGTVDGTLDRCLLINCTIRGDGYTNYSYGEARFHSHCVNLYRLHCKKNNGNYSDDIFPLTLGSGVSVTRTGKKIIGTSSYCFYNYGLFFGDKHYFSANNTVQLNFTGEVPAGSSLIYTVNGSYIDGDSFAMPSGGATVEATFWGNSRDLSLNAATVAGRSKYVTSFYHGAIDYRLPEGALAYTAGLVNGEVVFYCLGEDSKVIPHGTAVIIIADSDHIELSRLDTAPGITPRPGNILQGSDNDIPTPAGNVYVLGTSGNPAVLGFYKFSGSTIPAGKAYYIAE